MADSSGVVYRDLVSVPETEPIANPYKDPSQDPSKDPSKAKEEAAVPLHEGPTASHALATSPSVEEPGLVQLDHDEEVKDLGWNQPKEGIPAPLVGGMENEDLWVLVRRFDKVCLEELALIQTIFTDSVSSKCTTSKNTRIQ
jgi:hypothetical protein